jgi:hypothetical protein
LDRLGQQPVGSILFFALALIQPLEILIEYPMLLIFNPPCKTFSFWLHLRMYRVHDHPGGYRNRSLEGKAALAGGKELPVSGPTIPYHRAFLVSSSVKLPAAD